MAAKEGDIALLKKASNTGETKMAGFPCTG